MRIVHQILSEAQSTVSTRGPYLKPVDEDTPAAGFPIEVLISVSNFDPIEETIEIEGDAGHIREALLDAIDMIDVTGARYVNEGLLDPKWKRTPPKDQPPEIPDGIGALQWERSVALAFEHGRHWGKWVMSMSVPMPSTWTEAQAQYNAWDGALSKEKIADCRARTLDQGDRPWPTFVRESSGVRVYTVWPDGSVDLISTDGTRAHVDRAGNMQIQYTMLKASALSELANMASTLPDASILQQEST